MGSRKKKQSAKTRYTYLADYLSLSINDKIALKHYLKWEGRRRYDLTEILSNTMRIGRLAFQNAISSGHEISNIQTPF